MTISPLADEHVRTLSLAASLERAHGAAADPADVRVVRMVRHRWLRLGASAHMAAHEWAAVRRAATALKQAEGAAPPARDAAHVAAARVFLGANVGDAAVLLAGLPR